MPMPVLKRKKSWFGPWPECPWPPHSLFRLLLLAWVFLAFPACASLSPSTGRDLPASNATLNRWVENTGERLHPEIQLAHPQLLGLLYRQAGFGYFWLNQEGRPTPAARLLLQDLQPWLALEEHPRLQTYRKLADLLQSPLLQAPARHRHSRDLVISDLFLRYQEDLLSRYWTQTDETGDHGIINANETWEDWPDEVIQRTLQQVFPRWLAELQTLTPQAWAQARIRETRPLEELYQPWRAAFARLQEADRAGDWPHLETSLFPGDHHPQVAQLALQLSRLGDLDTATPWLFVADSQEPQLDERLQTALKRFQRRHQLPDHGRVDEATRHRLNIPPRERMRRLAHNLRRLYHLPPQLNARHLMINLADQQLEFRENGQTRLAMRVIAGRSGQRTPIMSQWLTSLVLNPIWNVPPRIAQESILPRARNNPGYLASRDYALVEGWHTPAHYVNLEELPEDAFTPANPSYRLVQKAGNHNQLGRAKFRLSNQKAIYLHDTPYQQLFQQTPRTISSGCVRLEDARGLVSVLLAPSETWTPETVASIYAEGEERYLQVRPRVAVYLMYWTAWTDAQGQLQWREDLYHLDQFTRERQLARQNQ
ncbi:L,D-transpeptidase family protein [Marinospirillum perlucidum]|uniref:L,D-transpeptidase family protein n=1 Tax=Marinospirillum perlucidum TaxID=1982602 RepID=UPI000DF26A19|nr:L,D-transpeptidase family protein [Marinospirillum perlucidum]